MGSGPSTVVSPPLHRRMVAGRGGALRGIQRWMRLFLHTMTGGERTGPGGGWPLRMSGEPTRFLSC